MSDNLVVMKKRWFLCCFLGCLYWGGWSQVDTLFEDMLMDNIDQITDDENEGEVAQEELLERWQQYAEKKINLNNLEPDIAHVLLQLTDYQYYQLQLYIEKYGELVSVGELAAVEGFDKEDVERIRDRVEVVPIKGKQKPFARFFQQSRQMLLVRYGQIMEKQGGYDKEKENGYLGNPLKLSFKYAFQSGEHFSMALAGEKDPGEQFFKGTQKQGFDHYSFFVNISKIGLLRNCVIGDYRLGFGQGLVLGSSLMGRKGGGTTQVRQFSSGVQAAAPMNENNCLRGAAVVIGTPRYAATLFYGHRFFDGKIIRASGQPLVFEGSLNVNGYHRTISEIEQKNQLRNRIYGAHLEVNHRVFSLGLTCSETDFIYPRAPADELYKKYDFLGKHIFHVGIDHKWIIRKVVLFGEAAYSSNQGWGILQGLFCDLDPRSKVSVLFRYYDKKYWALQAAPLGESKSPQSEGGLYITADYVTSRRTSLSLYADYYWFPWLRFRTDSPTANFDCAFKFQFTPSRKFSGAFKYQYKHKYQNGKNSAYYNTIAYKDRHVFRLTLQEDPISWLKLKTEINLLINVIERQAPACGFLFTQDLNLTIEKWKGGGKLRFAIFNTDSYEEKIGSYEQDLLYTFTVNNYYGRGVRYYLILFYQYRFVNFQVKFSQTYWDGKNAIGSGNTLIKGNTKSELKAQIIFHI